VDRCPLPPATFLGLGALEWRGPDGRSRVLTPRRARAAVNRFLVRFEEVATRDAAAALVNGTLWVDAARLPEPGPGQSYAFALVGMRVVDTSGQELGRVADVVFNVGQPLLQLEGGGKLLPCQPPFVRNVDQAAGVITLELPAGFDEL